MESAPKNSRDCIPATCIEQTDGDGWWTYESMMAKMDRARSVNERWHTSL